MNSKLKQLLTITLISSTFLVIGCSKESKDSSNTSFFKWNRPDIYVMKTMEVSLSCNQGNINTYLEEGWEISEETQEEVTCTWKKAKANKRCNIKKDKGCMITVPDETGIKTTYTLVKKEKANKN